MRKKVETIEELDKKYPESALLSKRSAEIEDKFEDAGFYHLGELLSRRTNQSPRRRVMRKNEMTFGRVPAESTWGDKSDGTTSVVMNMKVEQVAVLAALCQRAVQEHYEFDRRSTRARNTPVQLLINYGAKALAKK